MRKNILTEDQADVCRGAVRLLENSIPGDHLCITILVRDINTYQMDIFSNDGDPATLPMNLKQALVSGDLVTYDVNPIQ